VIGVLGGSGGVGASSFAAVSAATLGEALAEVDGRAVLVDADPAGGGIDVLLGIEGSGGVRWSGLRVGGGRLDPEVLLNRLPSWRGAGVLACDRPALAPSAARQVIEALAQSAGVVVDLPRNSCPLRDEIVAICRVLVVVVVARLRDVAAAGAVVRSLPAVAPPTVVVLRGGEVDATDVEDVLGVPVVARIPPGTAPLESVDVSITDAAGGVVDAVLDPVEDGFDVPEDENDDDDTVISSVRPTGAASVAALAG
jgi:secretion/DNA translocation related CpaE-like protein